VFVSCILYLAHILFGYCILKPRILVIIKQRDGIFGALDDDFGERKQFTMKKITIGLIVGLALCVGSVSSEAAWLSGNDQFHLVGGKGLGFR